MRFLAPLFLTALVAAAIPIILHLVQREKREAIAFPSLMFLRRIPHQSTRRRRIRDLPLLLLRIAAVALLAAAFARPLLERNTAASAVGGAREVVLLVDRSYSMGAAGRWAAARAAALGQVDRLRAGDRMTVVAFDNTATALNTATGDTRLLRSVVSDLRPGSGVTRFDPALRLASEIVAASTLPRREVVLVSDLQRSGAGEGMDVRLPARTVFSAIVPPPNPGANLALAGVSFRRAPFGGEERVTATARVVNPGDVAVRGAGLSLELEGRPVHAVKVDVPAHSAASVDLPPFTLARPLVGTVTLGADVVAADNSWSFSLAPRQAISVLVLNGRPGASLFLERALAAGGGEPGFDIVVRNGELSDRDLTGRDVVVLDGMAPAAGSVKALRRFVEQGGGLVVAAGPAFVPPASLDALLPGPVGAVHDRVSAGGAALVAIDMTHPVFDVFRAPHSGDLSAPRFYRYRGIDVRPVRPDADTTAVLARFDDGSVALAERRLGRGRVVVWGSTLDRDWSDLPVQPVFVPFAQRLVAYSSSFAARPSSRTVGDVLDPRVLTRADAHETVEVVAPDGRRDALEPGRTLRLEQSGFYTLRPRGSSDPRTVAVNVDVSESVPAAFSPADFARLVRTGDPGGAPATTASLTDADRERKQALWWWAMLAVAGLLTVETVLSSIRSRMTMGRSAG